MDEKKKRSFKDESLNLDEEFDQEYAKKKIDQANQKVHHAHHFYGGSYVVVFKIANVIVALAVAGLILFIAQLWKDDFTYGLIPAIVVGLIIWYVNNFIVKQFENISIIAKNSTKILNILADQEARKHQ
ncbi:hypothetical protein [Lactiplantibacillus songbeiensis]|uniref:Uncharacterized protein n=1 Tax=Lactiplantibacillus songbeiensis TaxID=2559920 RepID=A0ABW4C1U1_9LACO|nr:hypothetical protein [Lactiplantibacillus songbeiensis]